MERQHSEQVFHDRQALARAGDRQRRGQRLVFTDDAYLDHETWIRPAFARLGNLDRQPVLDFGCGHGMAAVVLARRGARVTAFDLSHGYLDEARQRARDNNVPIQFVKADGECLPFADATFQAIWGSAILHHLDLARSAPEIRRILRPDGVAVFCEPWGGNPLLNWARQSLPYPEKGRTADERPLDVAHLRILRAVFTDVEVEGHQLLGMTRRVLKLRRLLKGLDWCDRRLLAYAPRLVQFCRYVVLTARP